MDVFGIHEDMSILQRIIMVYELIWVGSPPSNKTCERLRKLSAFVSLLLRMNDPKDLSSENENAYIALAYKDRLQEELRTVDIALIKLSLRYHPMDMEHHEHLENIKEATDAYNRIVKQMREKTTEALQQLTGTNIILKK